MNFEPDTPENFKDPLYLLIVFEYETLFQSNK